MGVTSAIVATSIAAGAGAAYAVPEQGGTTPQGDGQEQGGTAPDTTGTPEGTAPIAPIAVPGPGSIPAPPQEAPYQPYVPPQSRDYDTQYDPIVNRPHTPRPAAPVRPIAPPENKIRVGNVVADIPAGMSQRDVNSINAWSAYGEAKIAQGLISLGVPKDEASRRAAATIIGVMSGGVAGAAVLGIPAAVVGTVGGAAVGAGVGAVIGSLPPFGPTGTVPGALIGAGVGAVVGGVGLGTVGAVTGGVIGGTMGGLLAYALGAGDPGAHPTEPWKAPPRDQPQTPRQRAGHQPDQFRYQLPAEHARRAGLPAVDYTVNYRGDVHIELGATAFGWSVEQALAPYALIGGPQAEQNSRERTRRNSESIENIIPGAHIDWPQEHPGPRHRA